MPEHVPTHAALLPVKPPAHGKSRLAGIGDPMRRRLAAAFALDTATACLRATGIGEVLVVSDDAEFADALSALGCHTMPDGVTGDLNATLVQAAAEAVRRWPTLTPVAVCADLPALRAADLDTALSAHAPGATVFVCDAAGLGTTMYAAAYPAFGPRFGIGSRLAHEGSGALPVPGELRSLRQDVDDLDDLAVAAELGLGPHTRGLAAELGVPGS